MGSDINVLVVDDEPAVCQSLVRFLREYGYNVTSAGSAEEALGILNQKLFNAGIIDLRLPGLDGEALILKAKKIQPSMRFLIHTGSVNYNLSDDMKRIDLRREHIFKKPLDDLNVLVKAIQHFTDNGDVNE